MPFGCNACNSRIQKLSLFLSLILFPTWIVVNDINFRSTKVIQWVPRRHKVLTHGQERLFRKVTSVSIHSFVEWLDTFSYVLLSTDVTVKEVYHIRCFAIDIAKDHILLSCRLAMGHLCAWQLETALATLVTTWFTLADRRWRSRYPALTSVSLLSLGRRNATTGGSGNNLVSVSLFSISFQWWHGQCLKFSLKRDGTCEQGEPVRWFFFLCTPGGHFCQFHWPLKTHSL